MFKKGELNTMDKKQADALCTVITAGFVEKNLKEKRDNLKTFFIYENSGPDRIKTMGAFRKINGLSSDAEVPEAMGDDKPIIYAKKPELLPHFPEMNRDLKNYNEIVNSFADLRLADQDVILYGAYVGGKYNVINKQYTFIDASQLYFREKQIGLCKNYESEAADENFAKYNIVSQYIHNDLFLGKKLLTRPFIINSKFAFSKAEPSADPTYKLPVKTESKTVLSSCHGLVNAIYTYGLQSPNATKYEVCIEFSLSKNTSKAASCIPCAIFAASQGQHASYTHFGRGDYWSLPESALSGAVGRSLTQKWKIYVSDCYKKGCEKLRGFGNSCISDAEDCLGDYPDIALAFLDALTFPGSFADKIDNSLDFRGE
jgi:hypothetical protein